MKKLVVIVTILLLVGAYLIVKNNDYDLKNNPDDRTSFLKDFSGWVVNLGNNLKDLTGGATKQDWLPQEYNDSDSIK